MGAVFRGVRDELDEQVRRFAQAELTRPIFLNAVPKSGIHLIRNILRMFLPPEQHYSREFIQVGFLREHARAFSPENPCLSCGHLLFTQEAITALGAAHHILLVRDPYDWVIARARFYLSEEYRNPALAHLKSGAVAADELLTFMILGIPQTIPSLRELYMLNAVAWTASRATLVRYEDVVGAVENLNTVEAEGFFMTLLDECAIQPVPADWRARVAAGADRRRSRTARENLTLSAAVTLPDTLPEAHKAIVEFAAPGLRRLLGY